jgi:acyl carrier protein
MGKNEYKDSIKEFFKIRGFDVSEDVDLFECGAIDSMDIVELVVFIEEELHVKIDVSALMADNFRNLNSIYKLLENEK